MITTTIPRQTDRLRILYGDCALRLLEVESASVQLVVTSPPYDNLRTYGGHPWSFEATARELYRVLCDGGVVCWNVGDSVVDGSETLTSAKQKIFFREECGFRIHDTMIYEKVNPAFPSHVRYDQTFEYIFVLSKGAPKTWNPIRDKRNVYAGQSVFGRNTQRQRDGSMKENPVNTIREFGLRSNVWRGNTRGQEELCKGLDHPAMMPKWLARDLIISWSNPGDIVLDPFAGSFTTCVEALGLGRNAIGIEVHADYVEIGGKACENVTVGLPLD